jgi:hypothetical protein
MLLHNISLVKRHTIYYQLMLVLMLLENARSIADTFSCTGIDEHAYVIQMNDFINYNDLTSYTWRNGVTIYNGDVICYFISILYPSQDSYSYDVVSKLSISDLHFMEIPLSIFIIWNYKKVFLYFYFTTKFNNNTQYF